MPLYLDVLTFDELELLSFDELAEMEFTEPDIITDADLSSLLQFNIRAFTRSLPTDLATPGNLAQLLGLWRGVGEEVEVEYVAPAFTISRRHVGALDIERMNVGTLDVARRNVGTLEVGRG